MVLIKVLLWQNLGIWWECNFWVLAWGNYYRPAALKQTSHKESKLYRKIFNKAFGYQNQKVYFSSSFQATCIFLSTAILLSYLLPGMVKVFSIFLASQSFLNRNCSHSKFLLGRTNPWLCRYSRKDSLSFCTWADS